MLEHTIAAPTDDLLSTIGAEATEEAGALFFTWYVC